VNTKWKKGIRVVVWVELLSFTINDETLYLGGFRLFTEKLDVVVVPLDASIARTLKFAWLDEETFPRKCSINADTFVKQ